jgi:hypothetical protein
MEVVLFMALLFGVETFYEQLLALIRVAITPAVAGRVAHPPCHYREKSTF